MNINRTLANRNLAAAAALLVAASLAACSNDSDSSDGTDNAAAAVPVFTTDPATAVQNPVSATTSVEDAADPTGNNTGKPATTGSDAPTGSSTSRDASTGTICIGGEDITITEDNAFPIIAGECGVVTITASNVEGSITNAREVHLNGANNSINGEHWTNLTIDGDNNILNIDEMDHVVINGNTNTVLATTITRFEVYGDVNVVNWSDGAQAPVADTGRLNTYTR